MDIFQTLERSPAELARAAAIEASRKEHMTARKYVLKMMDELFSTGFISPEGGDRNRKRAVDEKNKEV